MKDVSMHVSFYVSVWVVLHDRDLRADGKWYVGKVGIDYSHECIETYPCPSPWIIVVLVSEVGSARIYPD